MELLYIFSIYPDDGVCAEYFGAERAHLLSRKDEAGCSNVAGNGN